MVGRGYARQVQDGRYSPGSTILSLSAQLAEMLDLAELARPAMEALQKLLPETVHLALLEGDHAVYIAKLDGLRQFRMASQVGNRLDLHCTSIGKAILAHLSAEDRRERVQPAALERRTAHTITSPDVLEKELESIRDQGFAIDDEENEEQIRCVGAAVFDEHGHAIGALSLSAPAFAMPLAMARLLGPSVTGAACAVSLSLGARLGRLPPPYAAAARDHHLSIRVATASSGANATDDHPASRSVAV